MGRDVSDILKLCIALMKRLNYFLFIYLFFLQNYDLLKLRNFSGFEYRMTS